MRYQEEMFGLKVLFLKMSKKILEWRRLTFPSTQYFILIRLSHRTKGRQNANYFILGQVIPAANVPDGVDNYRCSAGKLKIIRLLYDPETGQFN